MRKFNSMLKILYGFLSLIILWYLAYEVIRRPIVPSPFDVFTNVWSIFFSNLVIHAGVSFYRIISGILIALIIGVPIGIFIGYFKVADKLFSPIIYLIYPIPKISLLPLIMLLCGLGDKAKISMIVLIIVFQIIVAVRDAVKNIPLEVYYCLVSLNASKVQIIKEVVLPSALGEIITSCRIALGTAISVLFFTETYGTEKGLGYFIMDAWMRVNYVEMYSGILILSLLGFVMFLLLDYAEKAFCAWKSVG